MRTLELTDQIMNADATDALVIISACSVRKHWCERCAVSRSEIDESFTSLIFNGSFKSNNIQPNVAIAGLCLTAPVENR